MGMRGQGVVEFLLLLVFGITVFFAAIKVVKSYDFVNSLTVKPWAVVSGMIECGVWRPCGVSLSVPDNHPSNRVISYRPDGQ